MALPENTFAEVTLEQAEVIWQDYDVIFLKDATGCMSLSVGSWYQLSDWGGESHIQAFYQVLELLNSVIMKCQMAGRILCQYGLT